jgi:predicted RNase H-like HicB family nuclease
LAETGSVSAGKDGPAVTRVSVRVVVFQDGDRVCAQCLEYDIAAQGKTLDDCLYELDRLIAGHIAINIEHGLVPLQGVKPAPRRFWDWFERSKILLPANRFPFIAEDFDRHGVVVEPAQVRVAQPQAA